MTMTKRELVKAAISHHETEKVPHSIIFCNNSEERYQAELGIDDIYKLVDNDLERIKVPWWHWNDLTDDWREPDPPTSRYKVKGIGPSYDQMVDHIKEVADTSGRYQVATIYASHWERANSARGIQNFLADMLAEPEFAQKLLDTIVGRNMVMLENIVSVPEIDGILLGSDWGTQQDLFMPPETWRELIRPGQQRMFDLIKEFGKDLWIHSCGNIRKIMPDLVEMGVDVLNPIQPECMDIKELKKSFGDKICFWGGISTQQTLPFGTPDDVKNEAREVRDMMSKDGGFILAPSQEIQGDVPTKNLLALIDVAKNG